MCTATSDLPFVCVGAFSSKLTIFLSSLSTLFNTRTTNSNEIQIMSLLGQITTIEVTIASVEAVTISIKEMTMTSNSFMS